MIYLILVLDDYGNFPTLHSFGNKKEAMKELRRMKQKLFEDGESASNAILYEIKYSPKKGQLLKNINVHNSF